LGEYCADSALMDEFFNYCVRNIVFSFKHLEYAIEINGKR
jgi:hypothetical protein